MAEPSHRRGAAVDRALLDAALQELSAGGYAALRMDAVAQRAGVSRSTLYRRWPDKAALVAALVERTPGAEPAPFDAGGLREALIEAGMCVARFAGSPQGMALLRLFANPDPELRRALRALRESRDDALRQALLPHAPSPEQAARWVELLPAACFNRAVILGEPLDRAYVEGLVDFLLGPAGSGGGDADDVRQGLEV